MKGDLDGTLRTRYSDCLVLDALVWFPGYFKLLGVVGALGTFVIRRFNWSCQASFRASTPWTGPPFGWFAFGALMTAGSFATCPS
jgi:hypothetical protein